MIKRILFFLVFICSLNAANGQALAPASGSQYRGTLEFLGGVQVDSFFWFPVGALTSWQYANTACRKIGAVKVNPADSLPYYMKDPTHWYRFLTTLDPVGTGTVRRVNSGFALNGGPITDTGTLNVDSIVMSSRARLQKVADSLGAIIATKGPGTVKRVSSGFGLSGGPITDTGTLNVDSIVMATRARLKKVSDSLAAIIATKGTVNRVSSGFGLSGGPITDTGTLNVDSLVMASRLRLQKVADSLGAIIATKGPGTVTRVSSGFGLTGGPITDTGTLKVDSIVMATRARLQKIADSLGAIIATKGTVASVSGVANRTTSTGGDNPIIDISAAYVGQTSINTVGTVTVGTWSSGAVIGGATMTLGSDAAFDMYYRNALGVLTRLANGTTGQVLKANTGASPSWGNVIQIIDQQLSTRTLIGTTTETPMDTLTIPAGTLSGKDCLFLDFLLGRASGGTSAGIWKAYLTPDKTIASGTPIGTFSEATNVNGGTFHRHYQLKNSLTSFDLFNSGSAITDNATATNLPVTVTGVNFANVYYIVITLTPGNSGDQFTLYHAILSYLKSS